MEKNTIPWLRLPKPRSTELPDRQTAISSMPALDAVFTAEVMQDKDNYINKYFNGTMWRASEVTTNSDSMYWSGMPGIYIAGKLREVEAGGFFKTTELRWILEPGTGLGSNATDRL
jgi:hypothetical protein